MAAVEAARFATVVLKSFLDSPKVSPMLVIMPAALSAAVLTRGTVCCLTSSRMGLGRGIVGVRGSARGPVAVSRAVFMRGMVWVRASVRRPVEAGMVLVLGWSSIWGPVSPREARRPEKGLGR